MTTKRSHLGSETKIMYALWPYSNDGLQSFWTRQAKYVQPNIEARSRNYCYCKKSISITYSECLLALVMQ
jgi:hypothetical protein